MVFWPFSTVWENVVCRSGMKIFRVFILGWICFFVLGLSSCGDNGENTGDSSVESASGITIEDFSIGEYSFETGDTKTFSISLAPKNLTLDDIIISVSDKRVISISEESIKNGWGKSTLSFKATAVSEGVATLHIMSADGASSSNMVIFTVEKPTKIQAFGTFKNSSFKIEVGDSKKISWHVSPKGLLREDIVVNITDDSIVSIDEISFSDDEKATLFVFTVSGISEGTAEIFLQSANGKVESQHLEFAVETAPVIQSFGKFTTSSFNINVGDTFQLTQHILPLGASRDDFVIEISDESVISVTENSFGDDEDAAVFVYTVKGLSPGQASVTLVSSDGRTVSQTLTFHVTEKDTSRTVYITNTGEKYHYLASCAGKSASATTLNWAKAHGYSACKKCAK